MPSHHRRRSRSSSITSSGSRTQSRSRSRSNPVRKRASSPIPRKEKVLTGLVCIQLTLAIWAIAMTHLWSQIAFASLSVIGMILVFIKLPESRAELLDTRNREIRRRAEVGGLSASGGTDDESSLSTLTASLSSLLRFPLFWAGLLLMIYIMIQGLNPAYAYETVRNSWRAYPIDHISWLPNSVAGPFHKINPWRLMFYLGAIWLFLCYAWVGIQKRRTTVFILWFLFLNSIVFCVIAIAQKQLGAEGIFWNPSWDPFPNFFGSVPYKNRGATLLYLLMGTSMALYFYQVRSMREQMKLSSPHLLILLGILIQYATLWTSFSRSGLAVGTLMLCIFFLAVVITSIKEGDSPILKFLGIPVVLLLIVFAVKAVPKLPDFEKTLSRFSEVNEQVSTGDLNGRGIVSKITWNMFESKKWYGWGAGSWRYIFAYEQMKYPEIANKPNARHLRVWADAHNDWFQYLSELGIIGSLFLLFFIVYPLGYAFLYKIRRLRCTHIILCTTLAGVFMHSVIELLFQNMAILCLTAIVILMLLKLPYERKRYLKSEDR